MQITKYVLTVGDHEPIFLPDNMSIAMDRLHQIVNKLVFQPWRRKALHEQITNMPRGGLTMSDDNGLLIKIERRTLVNQ